MQLEFIYQIPGGENLKVTLSKKEELKPVNSIIFIHGFKGFKDWGFFPYSANFFADRGYNSFTFNFSHNGIGDNPLEYTRLDKFAKNTISREVNELGYLIDGIREGFFGKELMNCKIGLIGHSRGGAASLGVTNIKRKEISAIALWASVAVLNRYSERQKEEWKKLGYFEVLNTRTNQLMRMDVELLDDIEQNSNGLLNLESAVKNLNMPLFIAHGGQDLTVPVKEAEMLYDWSDKEKTEFFILPTAGHTFDIQHPFIGSNDKFEKLLENTAGFFRKHL